MTSSPETQIPNGWRIAPLKEIAQITAGGDYDPVTASPVETDRHPFPVYANAIERKAFHSYSSAFKHPQGAVTITARGTLGFSQYRDKPFTAIGRLLVVWPNPKFDGRYLAEYLNSQVEFAIESTGVPQLTGPQAGSYEILIPEDVAEQQAIAEALSDADALIEGLERLIAKKRLIKQGAMQDLLTARHRLPGFSGEWITASVAASARISRMDCNPANEPEQVFEHYSLPAFDDGQVPAFEKGKNIQSNKFRVPEGSLLVSKLNPRIPRIWAPSVQSERAICSTEFVVLIPNEDVGIKFLRQMFLSPHVVDEMTNRATGTTGSHQRIAPSTFASLSLGIPSLKEQEAITEILDDMDAEIQALETRLDKARQIKEGMMQNLLTGRIRLV